MSVYRVHKTRDYTVMCNEHLRDKELSLKAKGLLSVMLSLPDDWDYTINGLCSICKENVTSIRSTLNELRDDGYLVVTKKMPNETQSKRIEYQYDIYETKTSDKSGKQAIENQGIENLHLENLSIDNQLQLSTKLPITEKQITKKEINNRFMPPTLEEVKEYCKERKNNVDAQRFYDYFTAGDWKDRNGKPVKSWKQKIISWEGFCKVEEAKPTTQKPSFFYPEDNLDDLF